MEGVGGELRGSRKREGEEKREEKEGECKEKEREGMNEEVGGGKM